MKATTQLATVREADLVQRFAHGYRSRLAEIIGSMNRSMIEPQMELASDGRQLGSQVAMLTARQQQSQQATLRCCLEAVDLVLSSHEQFAKLLGTIAKSE